ncbi:MAG: helix-turn-helix domain-containing protein [Desulfobacterales bacterium]|nr:helix-turn-helix domain-containing protein [Desulfobacterales bacterium]
MRHIRRIIRLHATSVLSVRLISRALNIPHSTVSDYIQRYRTSGLSIEDIQGLNDRLVYEALFPEKAQRASSARPLPDFRMIHRELRRRHVTRLPIAYATIRMLSYGLFGVVWGCLG